MPGRSSCWIVADACMLYAWPLNPETASSAFFDGTTFLPKVRSDHGPHSPLATGLSRSQSGTKLPRRGSPAANVTSFQVRLVLGEMPAAGGLVVVDRSG